MASRAAILTATAIATGALFTPKMPLLIWNATASAPIGLYAVTFANRLRRGNLVLAELPERVRQLAADRGYLPCGVPLVKPIAALSGDRICSARDRISIDDRIAAVRLAFDAHRRPLRAWHGCRTLARDEVFLLAAGVRNSFDGRYFGVVERAAVIGKLWPLWHP